jgi:hypothetical protein
LRDLGVGEAVDLPQDHRGALRLGKVAHVGDDRAELLPRLHLLERRGAVVMRVEVHRVLALGHGGPEVVQAPVAGDPVEPRPSLDRPLVRDHRRVCRHEHLLQHILRVLHRVQEVAAESQEARLIAVEENLEGAVVPIPDQSDEAIVALQPQERGSPR